MKQTYAQIMSSFHTFPGVGPVYGVVHLTESLLTWKNDYLSLSLEGYFQHSLRNLQFKKHQPTIQGYLPKVLPCKFKLKIREEAEHIQNSFSSAAEQTLQEIFFPLAQS